MLNFTPYIRYASDHTTDMGFRLERAILDFELIYLKEGKLRFMEFDQEYICTKGDILLLRPGINHVLEAVEGVIHQPHVHFDFFTREDSQDVKVSFKKLEEMSLEELKSTRPDITKEFAVPLPSIIKIRNPQLFETILEDLIYEFVNFMPEKELMLQAHFLKLWGTLCRDYSWNKEGSYDKYKVEMEVIKSYLSHHLEKEVTLDELSDLVNISKFHLLRLYKDFYGQTPMKYQAFLRLIKAKELIQYTSIPIGEIASMVGFHSIHSFSRWFKNQERVPPTFYRLR